MQRLGRIMVSLGVIATLGLWMAAALGLRGIRTQHELREHVLVALVPLLLFVLSHLWNLIYLLGASKVLRTRGERAGHPDEPALESFRRATLPVIAAAIVLATGCFFLGIGVRAGWTTGWVHGAAFYLAVVAEVFAAWLEWRTFSAAERSFRRLEAAA